MTTILIILVIWLIVFMHFVWLDIKPWEWAMRRKSKSQEVSAPEIERSALKDMDFIGKSLVKVKAKVTNAASVTPKAPQAEEGEEVDEKDVTFAPPKPEKTLRQMTPEEEAEAFKSFKFSKEEETDDTPDENLAEGYTYEDMVEAMKVAKKPVATKSEEAKAGKVLSHLDGTELLHMLEENQAEFSKRVRSIIKKYQSHDKGNHVGRTETDFGRKPFKLPENPTEFNIRDFV